MPRISRRSFLTQLATAGNHIGKQRSRIGAADLGEGAGGLHQRWNGERVGDRSRSYSIATPRGSLINPIAKIASATTAGSRSRSRAAAVARHRDRQCGRSPAPRLRRTAGSGCSAPASAPRIQHPAILGHQDRGNRLDQPRGLALTGWRFARSQCNRGGLGASYLHQVGSGYQAIGHGGRQSGEVEILIQYHQCGGGGGQQQACLVMLHCISKSDPALCLLAGPARTRIGSSIAPVTVRIVTSATTRYSPSSSRSRCDPGERSHWSRSRRATRR